MTMFTSIISIVLNLEDLCLKTVEKIWLKLTNSSTLVLFATPERKKLVLDTRGASWWNILI